MCIYIPPSVSRFTPYLGQVGLSLGSVGRKGKEKYENENEKRKDRKDGTA